MRIVGYIADVTIIWWSLIFTLALFGKAHQNIKAARFRRKNPGFARAVDEVLRANPDLDLRKKEQE